MKKMLNVKGLATLALASTILVSCGGGGGRGGNGGGGSQSEGWRSSSYITVNQFVNALNNVDGTVDTGGWDANFAVKYTDETVRGEGFFVYYDVAYDEYVAVDIDYLRTIEYWDYYSSNTGLASTFRDIQNDDEIMMDLIGDGQGLDYEIVDYFDTDLVTGEDFYIGFDSDELYEDEANVTDTGLMVANSEESELYKKAANYSVAFKIPAEKALSLATLEKEMKKMAANAKNGELSEEDSLALVENFEHFTGVSIEDFQQAQADGSLKEQLIEEVKANLGTEANSFGEQVLTSVFDL